MKYRNLIAALILVVSGVGSPSGALAQVRSRLGTNLSAPTDYSTQFAFLDAFKTSSPWVSGTMDVWNDGRKIDVDEFGWVKSLATDQIVRTVIRAREVPYPAGRYAVEYDGRGEILYEEAAQLFRRENGRDLIDVDPSRGHFILAIAKVHPVDQLRNIRIPHPGIQAPPGEIFNPRFLHRIQNYDTLRFTCWMLGDSSNSVGQARWQDRPNLKDARWTEKGVPLEVMLELANRLEADPWFNIPHQATDEYVEGFAGLVSKKLRAGLRAYVEHSNEVWNPVFSQHEAVIAGGFERGLPTTEDTPDQQEQRRYEAQVRYHALRSQEVFATFERALGRNRLVRVLATAAGNDYMTRDMLSYQDTAKSVDVLATGAYFGYSLGTDEWQSRMQEIARMSMPERLNRFFRVLQAESLPATVREMKADRNVAAEFKLPLVAYEGGQHLACQDSVFGDPDITALFHDANKDTRMAAVYEENLRNWDVITRGGRFIHAYDTGWMDRNGSWGALETINQPRDRAPKFDALERWMEASGQAPRGLITLPDLTGSWLRLEQRPLRIRKARYVLLRCDLNVENLGDRGAGAFQVRLYRSPDRLLDASDSRIDERLVPSLAAGARRKVSIAAVLPEGACPPGSYVLAIIDGAEAVTETHEENNLVIEQVR